MIKSLFTSSFVLAVALLQAQDIRSAKLIWTVTSLNDLNTDKVSAYSCAFKTDGQRPILWVQGNGNFSNSLIIVQQTGAWFDVNSHGSVTYSIKMDDNEGTLAFERGNNGVFITLVVELGSQKTLRHRYSVSTVTAN